MRRALAAGDGCQLGRRKRKRTKDPVAKSGAGVSGAGFTADTHRACIVLVLLALLLKSLIFAPISLWPVSFFCLVPWLVMIGRAGHAPRVYFYSYLFALAFFLINMRWLYPATGLGYVALSIYLAVYFPLMACALRHAVRRRRWPLAMVLPFVWVGNEMLRAVVISGFPWFYLSHSFFKFLTFIQVSDLVGAYGVSFVAASVNGAIADWIFMSSASRDTSSVSLTRRRARFGVGFAAGLVALTLIYGQVQLHRGTLTEGPKVAVCQGDFLSAVYLDDVPEDEHVSEPDKMRAYLSMMAAAAKEKPDLYLLPESPWMMFLNPESRDLDLLSRESYRRLQVHATDHNAQVVTGSASRVRAPYDLLTTVRSYNSATVFHPDAGEPGRYDKIHLVYFGEVVPFRFGQMHFLYLWLNSIMPFSGPDGGYEYSLFRGDGFHQFAIEPASQPGKEYRYGIPICYEDVMPYVSREFASGGSPSKRVDFLLNISNDGWFGRGIQQPQHLAVCVFRAVENRVGIARAVNTGVSGFIQPTGRIHGLHLTRVDSPTPWPGNSGFSVANVGVDSRYTFYSRFGDWFGWMCALIWLVIFIDYWILRARTLRDE